jgi:hypothetical protein
VRKICGKLFQRMYCSHRPAAWPGTSRNSLPYPATCAYPSVIAIDDVPGEHCTFGEHGWTNDKVNVITAINNMTKVLMDPHKT